MVPGAGAVHLVDTEAEFWSRLKSESPPHGSFEDTEEALHERVDLRLVEKIEDFLRPLLGAWEPKGSLWWHKVDCYGDGIRSLIFRWDVFRPDFVSILQFFLKGEHGRFCILCQFYETADWSDEEKVGSMAIYRDRILVTRSAVRVVTYDA